MPLSRVRITDLRCLRNAELSLDARHNYIFGANGAGKTSLLEGIFVLGRGRSFRTRQMRRLVRHGAEEFAIFGEVGVSGETRRLGVSYREGRFEKRLDGQVAAGMHQLAELLPVHSIDPSMHALIEGGPSERRRFLDWGVFHVEQSYLEAWKSYRRVLSQRNAALKARVSAAELRAWSPALIAAAERVDAGRSRYLERLNPHVAHFGRQLLDRALSIDYRPGWPRDATFTASLESSETKDREHGTTQAGPHRAEMVLRLDERRVQDEASRGQQKLTAAALVLSQVAVSSMERPMRSVLIIDDPAAELDRGSLDRLLDASASLPAQLVYTALTPAHLKPTADAPVFHVERGEVRAV